MPNYRTWIKYTYVNIIFHSILLFFTTLLLFFGNFPNLIGVVISLIFLIAAITLNIIAMRSIKRSKIDGTQIHKVAKTVAIISIIGVTVTMLFGVNPSIITADLFTKEK